LGKTKTPLSLKGSPMSFQDYSEVKKQIQEDISSHAIVLYMKGSKLMPQCGFSARVVQALNSFGTPYVAHNVLEDDMLREGIKEFSDWPTIPQLYIKGQFIGGCDIICQLHQDGQLETLVNEATSTTA
jgi:monothiol glutaredoxin